MAEDKLNNFIYCCMSFANVAHFDEERYKNKFLEKGLDEETFTEVIINNSRIAKNMHFGVCFTMTCWCYNLLYEMGINDGYYILETTELETGFPNYVLLFKYNDEFRICDLAAQILHIEEIHNRLFEASRNYELYKDDVKNLVEELSNGKYVNQSLEEYFKRYNGGLVIDATGIDDNRIFTDIPKKFMNEFIQEKLGNGRK